MNFDAGHFLHACSVLLLGTVAGLLPPQARADDASSGVMLPAMQSIPTGSVRVTAARVALRGDQIAMSVTARLQPGGAGRIVIHGPRFGWLGEAEPYPDRQFPELQTSVDGAPVVLANEFSAFVGSVDISATLRDARLDPFAIAQTPPFVDVVPGHEIAFRKLVALGAIQNSGDGALAQWEVARDISMTLVGNGEHTLSLTYAARPAYALIPFRQWGAKVPLASYCLSSAGLSELLGPSAGKRSFVVRQYAVPVGMDGRPPARMQVNVSGPGKRDPARALLAFCGSDGRAVVDRTGDVSAAAQTDSKGVLHVLVVGGGPH